MLHQGDRVLRPQAGFDALTYAGVTADGMTFYSQEDLGPVVEFVLPERAYVDEQGNKKDVYWRAEPMMLARAGEWKVPDASGALQPTGWFFYYRVEEQGLKTSRQTRVDFAEPQPYKHNNRQEQELALRMGTLSQAVQYRMTLMRDLSVKSEEFLTLMNIDTEAEDALEQLQAFQDKYCGLDS